MARFRLTRLAKNQLLEIARYTLKQWGKEQRDKYLGELDQAFHQLAQNPSQGRACDEIAQGLLRFRKASHYIYYFQDEHGIIIVGVLHGSMDHKRRLKK